MRGIGIAAECRANAVKFISSDSSANTATANQQTNFRIAILNGVTDFFGVVRIIVGNGAVVRAEVNQLVTRLAQLFDYSLVKRVPGMIRTNRNTHDYLCNLWMDFIVALERASTRYRR